MEIDQVFFFKIVLSLIVLGLVWAYYFFGKRRLARWILIAAFVPSVFFSAWGFYNFDSPVDKTGYWDLYHYYLNAKYFEELGYFNLYQASIITDQEGENRFKKLDKIRDLKTQQHTGYFLEFHEYEKLKNNFSPERWEAFQNDVDFFFQHLSPKVLTDRGYNATPPWNKTGSLIVNALPLENPSTIPILISLDCILFAGMVLLIFHAFGLLGVFLFLILWGLSPLVMSPLQGGFLRLGWIAALVASCGFFKLKQYTTSGALLACATMLQVFPIVFLGGLVFQEIWNFCKTKKVSPRARKFLLGFLITAAVLFFYGSLDRSNNFDFSRWLEFFEKIVVHSQTSSNQRSGLAYLIPAEVAMLRPIFAILIVAWFAIVARRLSHDKLIPISFVLLPVFVAPASYYFSVIAIFALAFADLSKRKNVICISLILLAFILQAFKTIQENAYHNSNTSYHWSALVFLFGLGILTIFSARWKNKSGRLSSD